MFQSPSNRVNIPNPIYISVGDFQYMAFQSPSNRVNIPNPVPKRPQLSNIWFQSPSNRVNIPNRCSAIITPTGGRARRFQSPSNRVNIPNRKQVSCSQWRKLLGFNPLVIGSIFQTRLGSSSTMRDRALSFNPLVIGSIFQTKSRHYIHRRRRVPNSFNPLR